jgi:hypothetical protein
MGLICCPETLVTKHKPTRRDIPEERRSHELGPRLLIRHCIEFYIRSVHGRCSTVTLFQLMNCFNVSVLQLLQRCYNFALHVSIVIRSSSGAYNFLRL